MASSTEVGPAKTYTTLAAWEAQFDGDLTGTGVCEAILDAFDDTTSVSFAGWTTTAADYIYVHPSAAARHAGVWDGDKYNIEVSNADVVGISTDYVRLDGLQISCPAVNGAGDDPLTITNGAITATNNDIRISNCIIKGANDATYSQSGISIADVDANVSAWNLIIYNINNGTGITALPINMAGASLSLYNSVLIGGKYGLYVGNAASTATVKNVYAGGSGTEDFFRSAGALAKTNCASEDQSADDTGTGETATNCVAAAVAIDTDTFVNVTGGSEDFHLAADGLSPLQGAGVDTSGDTAPLNFTTDIDGDTCSDWCIGADHPAAGGSPLSIGAHASPTVRMNW